MEGAELALFMISVVEKPTEELGFRRRMIVRDPYSTLWN